MCMPSAAEAVDSCIWCMNVELAARNSSMAAIISRCMLLTFFRWVICWRATMSMDSRPEAIFSTTSSLRLWDCSSSPV